jgi:hypothetical protein
LICDLGNNRGIGFDPAYVEGRTGGTEDSNLTFIKDYYSEKYSNYRADAIFCRMTLEHIPDTAKMIHTIRRAVGDGLDTLIFFQVPDVDRILRECAFEDIYYEHCSYFSQASLSGLFCRNGFEIVNVRSDYDGQYILLESRPVKEIYHNAKANLSDIEDIRQKVKKFPKQYAKRLDYWSSLLEGYINKEKKIVLWGSGSKGVAFLTALPVTTAVKHVVDISPYRQGTFMAGTGQSVVSPEFLADYRPDTVIVMNAIYRDEIKGVLDKIGLQPSILTLQSGFEESDVSSS